MKKTLNWLNENLEEIICVILMVVMTVLIFVQVIMRYVFNNSLTWSEELARYIFIWLVYIGISYGAKQQAHLKIDSTLNLWPKRVRPYIPIVSSIFFLIFAVYITVTGVKYSIGQASYGVRSAALEIPMQYVYFATVIGFGLTCFRLIQVIIKQIHEVREPSIKKEVSNS